MDGVGSGAGPPPGSHVLCGQAAQSKVAQDLSGMRFGVRHEPRSRLRGLIMPGASRPWLCSRNIRALPISVLAETCHGRNRRRLSPSIDLHGLPAMHEHLTIIAALKRRDEAGCVEAMMEHIANSRQRVLQATLNGKQD